MRLSLLCAFSIFICISPLGQAQSSGDPGEDFVTAYFNAQQGEKALEAGNYRLALKKLREAAQQLDTIAGRYPTWSPTIVNYRKKHTAEAIVQAQEKLTHFGSGQGGAADEPSTPPSTEPQLPEKGLLFQPEIPSETNPNPAPLPESSNSRGGSRNRKGPHSPDEGDYTSELNKVDQRMKDLEHDLLEARGKIDELQSEKAGIAKKLTEAEKARIASEQTKEVLEKRAFLAEKALNKEMDQGAAGDEKIAVLQKEYSDAKKALNKSKIVEEADALYRQQLNDQYKAQLSKISGLMKERDDATNLSKLAPGKIADIQKQLDLTKKEKEALAVKLQTMQTQLTEVSKQRDDALAQVTKLKEAQKQVDKLVADNASLMAKLADAQKSVAQFKADGLDKDKQIADLKKEVSSVKQQLEDTKKQSASYQQKMGDLQAQLEATAKDLKVAKAENTESAADKKKMQEENMVLRGIVLREQRKEADRQATKKIVLGELSKLEINSKTLLKQIDFLSEPIVKLTAKERALFKKPELQVSDTEISIAVSKEDPAAPAQANPEISVPDQTKPAASKAPEVKQAPAVAVSTPTPTPAPAPAPKPSVAATATPPPAPTAAPKSKKSEPSQTAKKEEPAKKPMITLDPQSPPAPALELASNTSGTTSLFDTKPPGAGAPPASALPASKAPAPLAEPTGKSADQGMTPLVTPDTAPTAPGTPPVPAELVPQARQAKEDFERGNYLDAEKIYRKILVKAPRNLYILSNLGVVLFRSSKFKLAEEMFNKAIAVAPEDGFSHCTLGIVYYSESKLDDAVNELTKALAINPKNPTAHNYLGITASQKGWPEAAQKELETAVGLDAGYADAYFNLAVVFATQQPPNKDEARKNYKRAIELGAESDTALEQLIK